MDQKAANDRVRFEGFEVDFASRELFYGGKKVPIQEQPLQVLGALLERPGQLVTRDELRSRLWPSDTFVDFDHNLNKAVAKLREALAKAGGEAALIETLTRRGYRFTGKIDLPAPNTPPAGLNGHANTHPSPSETDSLRPLQAGNASEETQVARPNQHSRSRLLKWLLSSAAVAAACLFAAVWFLSRPLPMPRITKYTQITHDGRSKDLAGTDGSRVYFTQLSPRAIVNVGVNGGEVAQVPLPLLRKQPVLLDISKDGSNALIGNYDEDGILNVRIPGGQIRRLGEAVDGQYSSDGESVLYTTLDGGLYTVLRDGTNPRKLAAPGRGTYNPVMSPDGKSIRFQTNYKLFEVSSDGKGLHRLLPDLNVPGSQWNGRWTADGSFYLFLVNDSPSGGGQVWVRDERHGLFRHPSSMPVQLTSGPIQWQQIIPSLDGNKIFAEGETKRGELSRFDSAAKQFKPFLGGISAEFVSFSRDGKSIAYVSFPDGILWKADRDGSNRVQLTEPPIYASRPRWSADGSRILFSDALHATIYTVSPDGSAPRRLMAEDTGILRDPDWSPDGAKFVFARGDFRDQKNEDFRIFDLATGRVTPIPGSTGFYNPVWSPDGRYIAALAFEKPALRVFDIKTQKWSALSTNGAAVFAEFSNDSRYLYFLRYGTDQGVFRIRVKGGDMERAADLKDQHLTGYWKYSLTLDPYNAPLVMLDVGTDDIYALTMDRK